MFRACFEILIFTIAGSWTLEVIFIHPWVQVQVAHHFATPEGVVYGYDAALAEEGQAQLEVIVVVTLGEGKTKN